MLCNHDWIEQPDAIQTIWHDSVCRDGKYLKIQITSVATQTKKSFWVCRSVCRTSAVDIILKNDKTLKKEKNFVKEKAKSASDA